LKKYKSPSNDSIPTELIQAGCKTLLSTVHKLINSIWKEEELPDQLKALLFYQLKKKGCKAHFNNCRGLSLPSTSYNISSNILLSNLSPYIDEIIGDRKCGFRRNRLTTD
jgi:hypothetical protein